MVGKRTLVITSVLDIVLTKRAGTWNVSSPLFPDRTGDLPRTDPNTHDMMTILDEEELVASAVVYPGSTEEVQQTVLWANKHRIPIFPISMGRNCTITLPYSVQGNRR